EPAKLSASTKCWWCPISWILPTSRQYLSCLLHAGWSRKARCSDSCGVTLTPGSRSDAKSTSRQSKFFCLLISWSSLKRKGMS
ncbi:Uncharacterized protein APZ42_008774, partial [Daphnia magna]